MEHLRKPLPNQARETNMLSIKHRRPLPTPRVQKQETRQQLCSRLHFEEGLSNKQIVEATGFTYMQVWKALNAPSVVEGSMRQSMDDENFYERRPIPAIKYTESAAQFSDTLETFADLFDLTR